MAKRDETTVCHLPGSCATGLAVATFRVMERGEQLGRDLPAGSFQRVEGWQSPFPVISFPRTYPWKHLPDGNIVDSQIGLLTSRKQESPRFIRSSRTAV
jgi:hypothetical protein